MANSLLVTFVSCMGTGFILAVSLPVQLPLFGLGKQHKMVQILVHGTKEVADSSFEPAQP